MVSSAIILALLLCPRQAATTRQETVSVAHYPDPTLLQPVEDRIAQQIIDIRKEANLPKLKRVYRREARQFACTAAVQGKWSSGGVGFLQFSMYTTDMSNATLTLELIARFPYAQRMGLDKFSVAAWPVSDPRHPPGTYGIGIMLFPRLGSDWAGKYLTDGFNFRNGWKKMVAPQCQEVK